MERMIPKTPRSGKRAAALAALLFCGSMVAFSAAARIAPGPALVVVLGSAILLLVFALIEIGQWIWRSRRSELTPPDAPGPL
ncbi:hypothetical protein [Leucobacter sp. PH1c]|uniref:hypothetical protein n=1 Tax=Leucobacter sp. PH1c TaxID=1397278 RepID=UPI000468F49F|nr:hypothetical protein [Leucobacter sp. PH1c]